ncbi:unnamed protein product [Ixodes hexagonus]
MVAPVTLAAFTTVRPFVVAACAMALHGAIRRTIFRQAVLPWHRPRPHSPWLHCPRWHHLPFAMAPPTAAALPVAAPSAAVVVVVSGRASCRVAE